MAGLAATGSSIFNINRAKRGVMSSTVVFSHGKESGPWGRKITAMAALVRELQSAVESVDYRGLDDPPARPVLAGAGLLHAGLRILHAAGHRLPDRHRARLARRHRAGGEQRAVGAR